MPFEYRKKSSPIGASRSTSLRVIESLEDRQLLTTYTGTGGAIVDNTTTNFELNIADSVQIADVDVQLDVQHSRDADLDVFLESPDGTRVQLFTDVGGNGDNFAGTILDDEAGTAITSSSAPFAGRFRPEGALSNFDGKDSSGTWTLEIDDDRRRQSGQVIGWSVTIQAAGPPSLWISDATVGEGDYFSLSVDDPTVTTSDHFGRSVEVHGNLILVGTPDDDTFAENAGQVDLFDTDGTLIRSFNSPNPAAGDRFGRIVSFDGNRALIGASGVEVNGMAHVGQAYLFDMTTGDLLQTFDDPFPTPAGQFGWGAAIDGDNVLVAAYLNDASGNNVGQAYLFDAVSGDLLQTLSDPTPTISDEFGHFAALDGDYVIVGAPTDDTHGTNVGQAYLFDVATGDLLHTFDNPFPNDNDRFGHSVWVDGENILIGAWGDDTLGTDVGQAYLFNSSGELLQTFNDPTPTATDEFSRELAIDGNMVLIGDKNDDTLGENVGQAHLFDAATGELLETFDDPTPTNDDHFGRSMALDGNTIVVGAHRDNTLGFEVGQFHIFKLSTDAVADFTVSLSAPSEQIVTVDFGTTNDSATAGSDYSATSGTLTFAPGVTSQSILIPVIDDSDVEGDETFNVTLNSPAGATIVGSGLGIATIVDDDLASPSQPPAITTSPITDATEDGLYSYDVDAIDPDAGDTLTFSLDAAPAGMTINVNTGLILWTPNNADVGSNSVTVRVQDQTGASTTQSYSVDVVNTNDAPEIISATVTSGTEAAAYSYDVDAVDPDANDTATYSLDESPSGMTVHASTGVISWTPQSSDVGAANDVTVRVTDSAGAFDTQSFSINVSAPSENVIFVSDIWFESKRRDRDWRAVFEVRDQDSNPISGVQIEVDFAGNTYTGTTDSNGIFRTSWIRNLSSGNHYAEAADLAFAGHDWDLDLGWSEDYDEDGFPDALLVN